MTTLRIATTNQGKLAEFEQMLAPLGCVVKGMHDIPHVTVIEDGDTFEANAIKKARAVMVATGDFTLADDSGLEVDALGGAPGVWSARYAGVEGPQQDQANRAKLLHALQHITDPHQRTARFVCALAWCAPASVPQLSGEMVAPHLAEAAPAMHTVRGTMEGQISMTERGSHGFGYDPVFWLPEQHCTVAELPPAAKHAISHRGAALRAFMHAVRSAGPSRP